MEDRMDVTIMGVKIGTADGWDQGSETALQFNDFQPEEKFNHVFEECVCLTFDSETGIVELFRDEGETGKEITNKKVMEILLAGIE